MATPSTPTPRSFLERQLGDMPQAVRRFVRQGFESFSALPREFREKAIAFVLENQPSEFSVEVAEFSDLIAIEEDVARPLAFALSWAVTIFSETEISPEEFVEEAKRQDLLSKEASTAGQELAGKLASDRAGIKDTLARSRTSRAVLPSLDEISIISDLRVAFKKDEPLHAVPIALVHIDTDIAHHEFWFQMTKSQLKKVIAKLQKTMEQLEQLDNMAKRIP